MDVVVKVYNGWMGLRNKMDDPRVAEWPMMSAIWPTVVICLVYTWVVLSLGPKLMANREPFQLRNFMIVYNFLMVVLCFYIMMEFLLAGWLAGYRLCELVDFSRSKQAMRMASVCWLFYISKFAELTDTILFVMRKKFNQVTFLHVIHHAIMPVSWWFVVSWTPGGAATFHSLLNSFIHVMMYTYYGVAGLGPAYQKYLWWKKYMTLMQLTQFALVMCHCTYISFIEPGCKVPLWVSVWIYSYALFFFGLFMLFYKRAYKKPSKSSNGTTNGLSTEAKKTN